MVHVDDDVSLVHHRDSYDHEMAVSLGACRSADTDIDVRFENPTPNKPHIAPGTSDEDTNDRHNTLDDVREVFQAHGGVLWHGPSPISGAARQPNVYLNYTYLILRSTAYTATP